MILTMQQPRKLPISDVTLKGNSILTPLSLFAFAPFPVKASKKQLESSTFPS